VDEVAVVVACQAPFLLFPLLVTCLISAAGLLSHHISRWSADLLGSGCSSRLWVLLLSHRDRQNTESSRYGALHGGVSS
jgi:uncharacterized membrane protein AbrB (regulator of aidB expression)